MHQRMAGRRRARFLLFPLLACAFSSSTAGAQEESLRTVELETTEVTAADVTLSPDGAQLVFTLLGHLFALPVGGGEARQLTFGAHRSFDPTFSPDGSRLAFASNRDGSDGNIFVLDLADGSIAQATHQRQAVRPAFSPDGRSIAYISQLSRGHHCPTADAVLREVDLESGADRALTVDQEAIRSVFYRPDGDLAWTVHIRGTSEFHEDDRTEVRSRAVGGTDPTVAIIPAVADRVVEHPGGQGFLVRARKDGWSPAFLARVEGGVQTNVTSFTPEPCFYDSRGFAVRADGETVFLGDAGRLWKVSLTRRAREPIRFEARVRLRARDRPPIRRIEAPSLDAPFALRSLLTPVVTSDGDRVIFGAAGYLWRHDSTSGDTRRLLSSDAAFERDPALSPDGRQLAYVWSDGWRSELRVLELTTGAVDRLSVAAVGESGYWHPVWSPSGDRLAFAVAAESGPELRVVTVDPNGDDPESVAAAPQRFPVEGLDDWSAHPWFSADGRSLYYAAAPVGSSAIYRVSIETADTTRVTSPSLGHAHRPVSVNGDTRILYRHNHEIRSARLEDGRAVDGTGERVSDVGGESYTAAADGAAVLYSSGNQLWRQALAGGIAEELPVRLAVSPPIPPPMRVRRVRLLDLASGRFSPPTDVSIVNGRINRVGAGAGEGLPAGALKLDAEGRFAIPGLFEMHGHVQRAFNGSWLAFGITSLRDVGGPTGWVTALADRADAFDAALPRIFFSGDILHGASTTRDPIMLANGEEARRAVRHLHERGVHSIKTHPGLTWETQQALVAEAHRLGLRVIEHGTPLDYLLQAATVGAHSVEHTYARFRYQDDVLQLLAATGTRFTPTLAVSTAPAVAVIEDPERWVDARLRRFAPTADIDAMLRYGMEDDPRMLLGFWRAARNEVRAGRRRRVSYLAGTDAPAWLVVPGASLHLELAAFADAGFSPLQILRMATLEAATSLGVDRWLGSLEPGKVADLVLLDSDPLVDIRNTRTVWWVIKGGRSIDPETLARPGNRPPQAGG